MGRRCIAPNIKKQSPFSFFSSLRDSDCARCGPANILRAVGKRREIAPNNWKQTENLLGTVLWLSRQFQFFFGISMLFGWWWLDVFCTELAAGGNGVLIERAPHITAVYLLTRVLGAGVCYIKLSVLQANFIYFSRYSLFGLWVKTHFTRLLFLPLLLLLILIIFWNKVMAVNAISTRVMNAIFSHFYVT